MTEAVAFRRYGLRPEHTIAVCASCLCAVCWACTWPTERWKEPQRVWRTVRELLTLHREKPALWARQLTEE